MAEELEENQPPVRRRRAVKGGDEERLDQRRPFSDDEELSQLLIRQTGDELAGFWGVPRQRCDHSPQVVAGAWVDLSGRLVAGGRNDHDT
jgi:hypothetical protein